MHYMHTCRMTDVMDARQLHVVTVNNSGGLQYALIPFFEGAWAYWMTLKVHKKMVVWGVDARNGDLIPIADILPENCFQRGVNRQKAFSPVFGLMQYDDVFLKINVLVTDRQRFSDSRASAIQQTDNGRDGDNASVIPRLHRDKPI